MNKFILILLILFFSIAGLAQSYIQGNNFIQVPVSVVTAGSSTGLTSSSGDIYRFTGSTTQTLVMASATTLQIGRTLFVANDSTGTVTVNASGGGLLLSMPGSSRAYFRLISNGSAAGTWTVFGANSVDVTIGTGNGLTISGQAVSLGTASTSTTGALTSADWNTFNGKQASGNYISALTGDVTASGPGGGGSAAATLATVNASPGTTAISTVTTNGKGLVTSNSAASTTGSGAVVLATSPSLATPALGTPTALVGTNITGTASGLTCGTVTTNANLTGDVTSIGNATTLTNAPVIAKVLTGFTSGAGTVSATDSILSAFQKINGNVSALSGTVTSVAMTGDGTIFNSTVTGSPITTSGTLIPALLTQAKNAILVGPSSGSNAAPTFRVAAYADIASAIKAPTQQILSVAGSTFTCKATSGNNICTNLSSATSLYVGLAISGTDIAGSAYITAITIGGACSSGSTNCSITMSANATGGSATQVTVTPSATSGTYVLPSSPSPVWITVTTVGGGGGGGCSGSTSGVSGSGGGGGGGVANITVSSPSSTYAFTVGTGGAGATSVGTGTGGGTTTFGSTVCSSTGGSGGVGTNSAISIGAGGAAGVGSGTNALAISGGAGCPGIQGTAGVVAGSAGCGGSSYGGGGLGSQGGASVVGGSAGNYGGGGGGGAGNSAGGAGGPGVIIVNEFYQ